jgi:hypothetical protein
VGLRLHAWSDLSRRCPRRAASPVPTRSRPTRASPVLPFLYLTSRFAHLFCHVKPCVAPLPLQGASLLAADVHGHVPRKIAYLANHRDTAKVCCGP